MASTLLIGASLTWLTQIHMHQVGVYTDYGVHVIVCDIGSDSA